MGLIDNSAQLLRWMVSGPEIARLITELESIQDAIRTNQSKGPDVHHHEQMKSVQERFQTQVKALVHSFEIPLKKTATICLSWTLKKLLARKWLPQSTGLRMPARSSFRCFWRNAL